MIRTRVVVGSLLALVVFGVLIGDQWLGPWFPVLLACLLFAGYFATRELGNLFPAPFRPTAGIFTGVIAVIAANWYPVVQRALGPPLSAVASGWVPVLVTFVAVVLAFFLAELYRFRGPGVAVPRLALSVFAVAYLGLLPSFLAQLRWVTDDPGRSSLALSLAVFVPKWADIGAFFTGTFVGRTKMTPLLSPKKTWEGFAGGMAGAVFVTFALTYLGGAGVASPAPLFRGGWVEMVAFGLVVGTTGVLGDLAESLIKRDGHAKDASHTIPGFGGVLDVIDSVIFAAPVSYLWLVATTRGVF